jgi:hypothetical protein
MVNGQSQSALTTWSMVNRSQYWQNCQWSTAASTDEWRHDQWSVGISQQWRKRAMLNDQWLVIHILCSSIAVYTLVFIFLLIF